MTTFDLLLWAWLWRDWSDRRSGLIIVKPETVLGWHRKGFRWFWIWKVRRGKLGGRLFPNTSDLIRTMSRENPIWGAPRIYGELLKLGIDINEPVSLSMYQTREADGDMLNAYETAENVL